MKKFEVGNRYMQFGIFGGTTRYTVSRITKDRKRILLSEEWFDIDGHGKRKPSWHDVEVDEYGNERALEWESQEYGKFWINA